MSIEERIEKYLFLGMSAVVSPRVLAVGASVHRGAVECGFPELYSRRQRSSFFSFGQSADRVSPIQLKKNFSSVTSIHNFSPHLLTPDP